MTRSIAIAPGVMAALAERAPARLARKLDAHPRMAEAWAWSSPAEGALSVVTDSGETVTISSAAGVLASAQAIRCSCLLSPKCLHVLAVARALPLADAPAAESPMDPGPEPASERVRVDEDARAAARALFSAAAAALTAGVEALGAVREGELLRAIHGARAAGLHRLAAAGLRVVRSVRALRERRPEGSLPEVAGALAEALACATVLAEEDEVGDAWIGTARRAYGPVGNLRLYGLFTEAVVTTTGFAGVITYLCDGDGRVYSRANVVPGEAPRASAAYDGPAEIGDATLSHRALGREGLFLSNATASADGRLGSGAAVRAVRAGASSWTDPGPRALFVDLEAQLERARDALRAEALERHGGWDLLFLEGEVLGAARAALLLGVRSSSGGAIEVRCVPPSHHPELRYMEGLAVLARAPGLRLRVVGRVRFDSPRTIELLAVGIAGSPEEPTEASGRGDAPRPTLMISGAHHGRSNLAFDRVDVEGASSRAVDASREGSSARPHDPLDPLRRRLLRAALGGSATLPPEAQPAIEAEARALETRMLPTGAEVLRAISRAARSAERTMTGVRAPADPRGFARAWLRAMRYVDAATVALQSERWITHDARLRRGRGQPIA